MGSGAKYVGARTLNRAGSYVENSSKRILCYIQWQSTRYTLYYYKTISFYNKMSWFILQNMQ